MKTLQYVKVQHEIVQHIKKVCYMKRLLQKKSNMEMVQYEKKCNMQRMQDEKSAT